MVKSIYDWTENHNTFNSQSNEEHKISSIIIEDNKEPVGINTERDIVTPVIATQINPARIAAGEIMTKPVVAIIGKNSI